MGQQSFTPEEILAASFAYTRSTVEGAGAIKGKNCQIQSIDPITGGVRIAFVWYLDDGTVQTDTADVMNGADGKGIKSVAIDSNEHLIITYTDNTTSDAGKIEVQSAVTSVNGKKGDVILKTSDITNDSDYVSDANYTHTDNNYDDTAKGIVDGVTAKLADKVDKVTGKDLSTNDYTDADKAIVDNVTTELANKADTTDVVDSASYDSNNHTILFKHGDTTLFSLDAAAFVKDGMVDNVTVTGGNLVIAFNTDAGKQNISIPISDIFDANNYYNKTAIDNLLSAKQDTLTFDNTPTADSNNPVKSGGVYTEVKSLKEILTQQINDNGVKNIMPYPFVDKNGKSQYGVTSIDNGDGTVTISGTNTSSTANLIMFNWFSRNTFLQNYVGETLSVSFKGLTTAEDTAYAPLIFYDANGTEISRIIFSSSNTHAEFTVTSAMKKATLRFHVKESKTVNVTLKAMVCLKSVYDLDPIWEPPAKTNQLLTKETTGLIDNQNVNGAVNMLPNLRESVVDSGITYTVNADGSVTCNGTATANNHLEPVKTSDNYYLPKGTYKLTGCPSGGEDTTYFQRIYNLNSGAVQIGREYGDGLVFTLTESTRIGVQVQFMSGYTANSLTFKPMITVASYTGDYVPYAKSNKKLTEDVEKVANYTVDGINKNYGLFSAWVTPSFMTSQLASKTILEIFNAMPPAAASSDWGSTIKISTYAQNLTLFTDIGNLFGITVGAGVLEIIKWESTRGLVNYLPLSRTRYSATVYQGQISKKYKFEGTEIT